LGEKIFSLPFQKNANMNFWKKWFQTPTQTLHQFLLKNAMLIDVRSKHEFEQGSIENAINIPLDDLYSRISELDKNKAYIVFCRSGNRSTHAKNLLEKNGFLNISNGLTIENILVTKEKIKHGNSSR
jgi:phage shock protein E